MKNIFNRGRLSYISKSSTVLEKWNRYFFQWLFIRICWRKVIDVDLTEVSIGLGGTTFPGYSIKKWHKQYGILLGTYPLSGWGQTPFKYLPHFPRYIWFKK